jgi:flavin-binding protein dodecin
VAFPISADGNRTFSAIQSMAGGAIMTQKVIEVVGTSKQSFAKAAENAVKEAAKTVRSMKWAHVDSFDMLLDGGKVTQYRATTKIYFDLDK